MRDALRRFIRRVLALHTLLLVLVMLVVWRASREVYDRAMEEAKEQAQRRQALLAAQTGQGIADFYSSILSDLDLFRRSGDDEAAGGGGEGSSNILPRDMPLASRLAGRLIWNQLEGRATQLFLVDRGTMKVVESFSESGAIPPQEIADQLGGWLKGVEAPAVSRISQLKERGGKNPAEHVLEGNLLCAPVSGKRRLLVAVVPQSEIRKRFLDSIGRDGITSATLIDESMDIVSATEPLLIGVNLKSVEDPAVRRLATEYIKGGKTGTEFIESAFTIAGLRREPRMMTVQSIQLPGKAWSLMIGSPLSDIDTVVNTIFRRAIIWAVFVVISVTGILVSTAASMISSRNRVERLRHEVLERELHQAREIQLAWLPSKDRVLKGVDVAAVNLPANHISGDFYDWFELDDGKVVVTIGDVTGHGMSATFLMATTQLLVRPTMQRLGDPGRCLEEVNRQLCMQVFNGQFVTILVLMLDPRTGVLKLASAGHAAPLVDNGAGLAPLKSESQLVLGVAEDAVYESETFRLQAGASMLLYTDGVVEAKRGDGERYMMDRLVQSVNGRYESPEAIIDAVVNGVNAFRQQVALNDDLTLVALQLVPVGARKEAVLTTE